MRLLFQKWIKGKVAYYKGLRGGKHLPLASSSGADMHLRCGACASIRYRGMLAASFFDVN